MKRFCFINVIYELGRPTHLAKSSQHNNKAHSLWPSKILEYSLPAVRHGQVYYIRCHTFSSWFNHNVFWKKKFIYIYILQFYFFYNIWDDILNSWNPPLSFGNYHQYYFYCFSNKNKNFNWIYLYMYSRVANKLTVENCPYMCEHSTIWNKL